MTSIDGLPEDLDPESVDIVILVFVISALHPDEWGRAVANIHKVRFISLLSDINDVFMSSIPSDVETGRTGSLP